MDKTLTAAQAAALAKLRALHAAGFAILVNRNFPNGCIDTGINTNVLNSLFDLGLITCAQVFRGGRTTTDLVVR